MGRGATSFRGGGDNDRRANIKRQAIIDSPTFKGLVDLVPSCAHETPVKSKTMVLTIDYPVSGTRFGLNRQTPREVGHPG